MYFESKLYLKENYTLNELREIFSSVINRTNDIERVLNEMECISPSLIDDLKGDCIYAFITTNYYYLFRYEPCIVIAHIELKTNDRNLKSNLKSILTTLELLRNGLKKEKKTNQIFSALRLLGSDGSYTGISFSKKNICDSLLEGIKSPKYLELLGLTIAAYLFSFSNLNDYVKSITPTIIIAGIIYIVQVVQKSYEVYNKEKASVE